MPFIILKTTDKIKEVIAVSAFRRGTVEDGVKEGKASMKGKTFALSRRWADTERICARNDIVRANAEARFKYKHGKGPTKSSENIDLLGRNRHRNRTTAHEIPTEDPGFLICV